MGEPGYHTPTQLELLERMRLSRCHPGAHGRAKRVLEWHALGLPARLIARQEGVEPGCVLGWFRRLGLARNGWDAQARKVKRLQSRQLGRLMGGKALVDVRRRTWDVAASKAGWGHALAGGPLHPAMLRVLEALAEAAGPLTLYDLLAGYGLDGRSTFRRRYLNPLLRRGLVVKAGSRAQPRGARLTLYSLAPGVGRHTRGLHDDGIDRTMKKLNLDLGPRPDRRGQRDVAARRIWGG